MQGPTITLSGYRVAKTLDKLHDSGKMATLRKDHYEYYQHLEQLQQAVEIGGNDVEFHVSVRLYNFVLEQLEGVVYE